MNHDPKNPIFEEILGEIPQKHAPEYLVVSDVNSKIILSTSDYKEAVRLASRIRQAGGQCTIFKSLKA